MHRTLITFGALILAAGAFAAQSPATPKFEVASVKPNVSGSTNSSSADSPGSYRAVNLPLRRLIAIAYRISLPFDRERIVGPSWIDTARFDVTARMPADARSQQIPEMMRALLAERFALAARFETREDQVYALVKSRSDGSLGPQLIVSSLDCSKPGTGLSSSGGGGGSFGSPGGRSPVDDAPRCGLISNVDGNGGVLRAGGKTMADLATNLMGRVNRTVLDRTGLTGTWDFTLRWTPENFQNVDQAAGPMRDGTLIMTALQEQLGLKLESQRGPVEFLIIDRVERPTPD